MGDDLMAMGIRLDDVAHIIQVALTPVFLLSAIASLLNVVNARLGRVADQLDDMRDRLRGTERANAAALRPRLRRLRRRVKALDAARASGALAGISICAATSTLFVGALRNSVLASLLFLFFGASVFWTLAALVSYLVEVLLSSRRPAGVDEEV